MMDLSTPVTKLPTVRESVALGLERLGIRTVRDLLFHFPRRHEDRRVVTPLTEVGRGMNVVVRGVLREMKTGQSFRRYRRGTRPITVIEALLSDGQVPLRIRWFHQRYLEKTYPPGTEVYLCGTADEHGTLVSPEIERVREDQMPIHVGRLVPIYPETAGVSSRMLRYLISRVLPLTEELREYLPEVTRDEEQLIEFRSAVTQFHFPEDEQTLAQARQRLSFDELFVFQLAALTRRAARGAETAPALPVSPDHLADAVAKLPFQLTKSQKESLQAILDDLTRPVPMVRLLAGDVGSGKTVVAGLAALAVARAGGQATLLAPTEILAEQHAASLAELLSRAGLTIRCLTASTPAEVRAAIQNEVRDGTCHLLIGTHALLHSPFTFRRLALLVVDEQHRFGVLQRGELRTRGADGKTLHFLSLSATPIPRTLHLTAYGDVEVSPLEPRPGQRLVRTEVILPSQRNTMYASLQNRITSGGQVFVVCPRVEASPAGERRSPQEAAEGERAERKAVESEYQRLAHDLFRTARIGKLHGKMKSDEKARVLEAFRRHELDLLVASTVVEVGVDIPNADTLLVEGSEHFGLATLHQLRGRVGRRGQDAVCFLATEAANLETLDRLRVLVRTTNGLEIAEEDLKRRGPGEMYGTRQHGGLTLKVASLADLQFLLRVRAAAERLLAEDGALARAPLLGARIRQLSVTTHVE